MAIEIILWADRLPAASDMLREAAKILEARLDEPPALSFERHSPQDAFCGTVRAPEDDASVWIFDYTDEAGETWLTVESLRTAPSLLLMAVVALALMRVGAQRPESPFDALGLGSQFTGEELEDWVARHVRGQGLAQAAEISADETP